METVKTVDNCLNLSPLYAKQREDVAKMRSSLLACSVDNSLAMQSLKNITVLRIYHQISRIINYTELMDKLEQKLYTTLNNTIDNIDVYDDKAIGALLTIQEKLQKNMIESNKLLQPLLDLHDNEFFQLTSDTDTTTIQSLFNATDRERIRSSAQAILMELNNES